VSAEAGGGASFAGIPKLYPAMPGDAAPAGSAGIEAGSPDGAAGGFAAVLAAALAGANDALGRADAAEQAFAAGRGGLQQMVLERAQADIALSIASAAATRTAQAVSTILAMQV
jgi:flagellar hook-basal body complex protein FliE